MIIGIYKITNPLGRVYIGQSTNIEKRRDADYKKLNCKGQPLLYKSLLKYGWEQHKFDIIEECLFEELNIRERYWQDYYNVLEEGLNCLLTSTNELPKKHSQETKDKISKGKKGHPMFNESWKKNNTLGKIGVKRSEEAKINMAKNKLGKPCTQEFKNFISQLHKGKVTSQETKDKISKSNKNNNRKITQEHKDKISETNRGKNRREGYTYSEESKNKMSLARSTPILCVETNEIFRNINQASDKMKISRTLIRTSCLGVNKKAKGFSFIYLKQ